MTLTAKDLTDQLIDRAKTMQYFEVKRMMDEPLQFRGGVIPFDIRANQECAWFKVLAMSQKEAEIKVDEWVNSQKEGWDD
jgi:hypothetical protein